MKRAVRFSFMDRVALARREATTRAELELGRRTPARLYLGCSRWPRVEGGRLAWAAWANRWSGCSR